MLALLKVKLRNSLSVLEPHSMDFLGHQHCAKKLSPKIALHFKVLCKSKATRWIGPINRTYCFDWFAPISSSTSEIRRCHMKFMWNKEARQAWENLNEFYIVCQSQSHIVLATAALLCYLFYVIHNFFSNTHYLKS